jgi:hypothetical protein
LIEAFFIHVHVLVLRLYKCASIFYTRERKTFGTYIIMSPSNEGRHIVLVIYRGERK